MIYLSKILPLLVLPLGVTLLLMLAGITLRRRALMWASILVLWISSTPWVSSHLLRAAEAGAVRTPATEAPPADAIVVLSAGRIVAPGQAGISEWGDPDRFYGGIELFQAGKAPLLVFTGEWIPWVPSAPLEGDILAGYARNLGVPLDRILTTGRVSNTTDEARAVSTLLRARQTSPARVLLVTSAFHMSRARRLFENAGLLVSAFPVDFQVSAGRKVNATDFLPSAGALNQTQIALREMYGRLFYRMIQPPVW